jgi:hypothetical protein
MSPGDVPIADASVLEEFKWGTRRRKYGSERDGVEVRVHEPGVKVVHQRIWCGRTEANPADIGPVATPEVASVDSDQQAQDAT